MANRRPLALLGALLMVIAIGTGIFFFAFEYPKQSALNGPGGRTAPGTITELGTEVSGRYQGYFAQIVFQDERGAPHRIQAFYTFNDWSALRQGQALTVRYLAADPGYAEEPRSYKARRDPRVMLAIDFGLFLFGFALWVLGRSARS